MAKKKMTTAGKALAVLLVLAMMLAVIGGITASADTLGKTIYVKTTKTTTPVLYYWVEGGSSNPQWPGTAMKAEGDDVYSLDLPYDVGELTGIIVNKDSGGGDDSKLTGDVKGITGNLYELDLDKWSMYDTSGIKITSFGGSPESPQYIGSAITLSMEAEGGSGDLQYKFSVSGAADQVLSDYSAKKSVIWNPEKEGIYTVLLEVKDGSGETNSRNLEYVIKDAANAEDPIFMSASPSNGAEIKKGGDTTVTITGAGGKINNNILFYKAEVYDAGGNLVNTPYYTTSNKVTFKTTDGGDYTVKMFVQSNSQNNKTVDASYTYKAVDNPSSDTAVESDTTSTSTDTTSTSTDTTSTSTDTTSTATDTASTATDTTSTSTDTTSTATDTTSTSTDTTSTTTDTTSTQTDTSSTDDTTTEVDTDIIGDVDKSGKVEVKDAYILQSAALGKIKLTSQQIARGDVNKDGLITLKDASMVQRAAAGIKSLV